MSQFRILAFVAITLLVAPTVAQTASTDLVVQESKLGVKETIDALAKALDAKGVKIAARIDHAASARSAGQELPPTELLIFGNPQLGTPLMRLNRQIGIDLPMKVLAWQEGSGKVLVAYTRPEVLRARHGIKGGDAQFSAMTAALAAFTAAAIAAK